MFYTLIELSISYSYGLQSNDTTTLEFVGVIERLKVNDIIFCLSVFEMGWYERLWTCIYKEVEMKMINGNAKSFLCVWEIKCLKILNQIKQIVVLKHWINNVTKIDLKQWTKGNKNLYI